MKQLTVNILAKYLPHRLMFKNNEEYWIMTGLSQKKVTLFTSDTFGNDVHRTVDIDTLVTDGYEPMMIDVASLTNEQMMQIGKTVYETRGSFIDEDEEFEYAIEILEAEFLEDLIWDGKNVGASLGFRGKHFHGTKEGVGEVWSEDDEPTLFWNFDSDTNIAVYDYLCSIHFDMDKLLESEIAIKKSK